MSLPSATRSAKTCLRTKSYDLQVERNNAKVMSDLLQKAYKGKPKFIFYRMCYVNNKAFNNAICTQHVFLNQTMTAPLIDVPPVCMFYIWRSIFLPSLALLIFFATDILSIKVVTIFKQIIHTSKTSLPHSSPTSMVSLMIPLKKLLIFLIRMPTLGLALCSEKTMPAILTVSPPISLLALMLLASMMPLKPTKCISCCNEYLHLT